MQKRTKRKGDADSNGKGWKRGVKEPREVKRDLTEKGKRHFGSEDT